MGNLRRFCCRPGERGLICIILTILTHSPFAPLLLKMANFSPANSPVEYTLFGAIFEHTCAYAQWAHMHGLLSVHVGL